MTTPTRERPHLADWLPAQDSAGAPPHHHHAPPRHHHAPSHHRHARPRRRSSLTQWLASALSRLAILATLVTVATRVTARLAALAGPAVSRLTALRGRAPGGTSGSRRWLAKGAWMAGAFAALAALLIATGLGGLLSGGRPAEHVAVVHLPSNSLIGVREANTPGSWAPVARFASATHVNPKLVLVYSNWRERFRYGFAKTAASHGAALLVQIDPWTIPLNAIADGWYDHYLRGYAQEVRTFGQPVVLGFGHEMNGNWYAWGYGHKSPAAFVAAWRHIVDVFRAEHANNVAWLWTVGSGGTAPLRDYWPGSRYVTWVGIDGYYEQPGWNFHTLFGPVIRQVRRITQKPILLSENAIGQLAGQAKMLPDLFAGIERNHLLGLVWFDEPQSGGVFHQNWRLEGNTRALAEFRGGVNSMRSGAAGAAVRK